VDAFSGKLIHGAERMGRNYLAGSQGDAISAVLAALGYHFGLLLRWPALLWP
jgi:IS5 family transposase